MHVGKRNQSFDYVMEGQSLEKSSTEKNISVFSCRVIWSQPVIVSKPV